jgi:hypothetical protein
MGVGAGDAVFLPIGWGKPGDGAQRVDKRIGAESAVFRGSEGKELVRVVAVEQRGNVVEVAGPGISP